MKNLIKINLNQTVSKTELLEKKQNTLQWAIFSFISVGFLALIIWISVLISNVKGIVEDQTNFEKVLRVETNTLTQDNENIDVSGISVEDVNHLKEFQNNRIFWGPKLTALIEAVPDDMVITDMVLSSSGSKRRFKMNVYLRHDTTSMFSDGAEYIEKNSSFLRGDELVTKLKNSAFIDHFKIDGKDEPLFSAVKYEEANEKGNELQKIVFEGELNQYYKKKRKIRKKK